MSDGFKIGKSGFHGGNLPENTKLTDIKDKKLSKILTVFEANGDGILS
ncbi:MAG: hypothetical protein SPL73_05195 [Cyanobacteriota bacterium]|nr:hypothetical protein [Cyanobacteriota bacterium]MDY6358980.1 hypothetical protein [Cyanobacteriota bacterium]MDY6364266.1 hypothetical protein [Cyanobacteriota bacterium]MDY6382731.1 hypothetical protein [Cyanobacteriota bacterium]